MYPAYRDERSNHRCIDAHRCARPTEAVQATSTGGSLLWLRLVAHQRPQATIQRLVQSLLRPCAGRCRAYASSGALEYASSSTCVDRQGQPLNSMPRQPRESTAHRVLTSVCCIFLCADNEQPFLSPADLQLPRSTTHPHQSSPTDTSNQIMRREGEENSVAIRKMQQYVLSCQPGIA